MPISTIKPSAARRLLDDGALLIDVREADEYAREKIPSAHHMPLSKLDEMNGTVHQGKTVIFYCRSGARTHANAPRLAGTLIEPREAFILEGGLNAWRRSGFPVVTDRLQPIELQRQVQIGAGSLAFVGTMLGLLVSPWFFIVPAFVGAGLVTAGATGFCGMAHLLMRAPWNQADNNSPVRP
ncbi:rhodanese family protein [Pseudorhodoplanes sp.]|uniref:rhodanese family protein n=1 Tax=Pseudorhodoplanes sp. TaxID=1934341 RepID=UPI002C9ECB03|nr:rhodanese family protein [Pseudorhodoplanes sp.]HWV55082.1 rhodanese family protein [Pseudorhodoplanes sp.]